MPLIRQRSRWSPRTKTLEFWCTCTARLTLIATSHAKSITTRPQASAGNASPSGIDQRKNSHLNYIIKTFRLSLTRKKEPVTISCSWFLLFFFWGSTDTKNHWHLWPPNAAAESDQWESRSREVLGEFVFYWVVDSLLQGSQQISQC